MLVRHMATTAAFLAMFAVIGTTMVALTFVNTEQRIIDNEQQALLRSLHELVPPALYNNDITTDTIAVTAKELLGTAKPVTIYRARLNAKPVAAILTPVAPDGYNGNIKLIIAINAEGVIIGVRVLSHRETPGLGDGIEVERSPWIESFSGHTLPSPGHLGWRVVKDGGIFDQFTGATITPRAVVKAVKNSLEYFQQNKELIFTSPLDERSPTNDD